MNHFKQLAIAAATGTLCFAAQASTLVFDFSGTVNLSFDPAYHSQQIIDDYTAIFTSEAKFSTFYGQVILTDFQNFQTGTHVVNINSNNLNVAIVSGLLGEIEGTSSAVTKPNPTFNPALPVCTSTRGCNLDGDATTGVGGREAVTNNPNVTVGTTFRPDPTQQGDTGALTIVDGKITSFEWYAGASNTGIVGSFNTRLFARQGWQTRLGSIDVDVIGATQSYQYGDTFFAANQSGIANVSMVPEPETYALMIAGLGAVMTMARRRKSAR